MINIKLPMTSPIPIFDGHNDSLTHILRPEKGQGRSFLVESNTGHLDLPRARKGNFFGGFFAIYTPPSDSPERAPKWGLKMTEDGYVVEMQSPLKQSYAVEFVNSVFTLAHTIEKESDGEVHIVRSFSDLAWSFATGALAMILHIEGAEAIDEQLLNLEDFYKKGLRSLGITWSRPNAFGTGVPFQYPHSPDTGPGLTKAGISLVKRCNELGIVLDLAHLNEQGFWDVAAQSDAPLIVSHAGAHALCPSTRNLTDDQIRTIAGSDGLVGVIFEPCNTRPDGMNDTNCSLEHIVSHIDYIAQLVGVDHVAFGSDFDGADMPKDIADVSQFPKLMEALTNHGYKSEDLEKLAFRNWFRVLSKTLK